ncbi:hypothetical protein FH972_026384 [Carpinus fangiana]|uniref:non-specific serine/threonine protein kinase n=1 Tax=Carpinus fangiana TaxID=176857 RepID=A0A5N6L3V1_9ROSI|nr:hypothetical protein FH972_026384 [Carpinus fangiana]
MASASSSNVVGVHYRVGKKIGEGSFGVIFEGHNLLNNTQHSRRLTDSAAGIPGVYYFGQEGLHNILVIDLLGPSLEDLFDHCNRRFSIKTTVMIAKQMISRVQTIHEKNMIYRDIKPDNFLIGRPGSKQANVVHVVDFGMAKQYRDPKTKQHIPYRERKALSGTARYMSINTHLGREQSRRDDLEALGHVFIYFLRGGLPWQGLRAATNKQKYEKIGERKQHTLTRDLCEGFPTEFQKYLDYTRNLGFEETPDYDYLRDLLTKALRDSGEIEDGEYDWMKINNGKGWEAAKAYPVQQQAHPTQPPNPTTREIHAGRSGTPKPGQGGVTDERLNAALPKPGASWPRQPSGQIDRRTNNMSSSRPSQMMDQEHRRASQRPQDGSQTPTGLPAGRSGLGQPGTNDASRQAQAQQPPKESGVKRALKSFCCMGD